MKNLTFFMNSRNSLTWLWTAPFCSKAISSTVSCKNLATSSLTFKRLRASSTYVKNEKVILDFHVRVKCHEQLKPFKFTKHFTSDK